MSIHNKKKIIFYIIFSYFYIINKYISNKINKCLKKLWNEKTLTFIFFFSFNSVSVASAPSCWIPLASLGRKCPDHYLAGKGRRDIYQIPLSGKIYIGDIFIHICTYLYTYVQMYAHNMYILNAFQYYIQITFLLVRNY